jgi:tetratricopeptide (TPR) repeat protein
MSSVFRQHLLRAAMLAGVALAFVPAANTQQPEGRVTILELTPHGIIVEAIARIEAEDYPGAIELLEEWPADSGEPPPEALYLLAVAHYRLGDYANAVPAAERAATLATDAPVHWLELVVDLLKRSDRQAEAIPWLERLVEASPDNKTYWLELSLAYERAGDFDRALATMRLANIAEVLTDDADYRRLSDLLIHQGLPLQGAEVLERALATQTVRGDEATYTKLAFAWTAAGELDKAVIALENAARNANAGNAYVRLAALQIERQAWSAAIAALHAGMDRGSLTDPAQASLLMGIALFRQGNLDEAREWLTTAAESDVHRDVARGYLDAIESRTARDSAGLAR